MAREARDAGRALGGAPRPWRLSTDTDPKHGEARIVDAAGQLVAVCHFGSGNWAPVTRTERENAAVIVAAVNAAAVSRESE